MKIRWLIFFLVVGCINPAVADYLEVTRSATIKQAPERTAAVRYRAAVGEKFVLALSGPQNGYYAVLFNSNNEKSWIYRTLIRRHPGLPEGVTAEATAPTVPGEQCHNHSLYGIPFQSDQIVCRQGYALGYNYQHKVADWVSYYLTFASVYDHRLGRSGSFRTDTQIPAPYRSGNSDYAQSGYDRGHLAPSASIDYSVDVNRETFYYSNMSPQLPGFNRNMAGYTGVWGGARRQGARVDQRASHPVHHRGNLLRPSFHSNRKRGCGAHQILQNFI